MFRWLRPWQNAGPRPTSTRAVSMRYASDDKATTDSSPSRITRLLGFKKAGSPIGSFDRMLRWTLYAWAGFVGWHTWCHYFYTCDSTYGISMLPTLSSFGDWVIISKWYRRGRGIHAGDLVSFRHPVKEGEHAIKRVVGLSGDLVLMYTPGKSDAMLQVPEGHCWVVGDNLPYSRDSRHFGPLPLALISGKVISKIDWQDRIPKLAALENGLQPATDDNLD
ncbi:Mitochondrial inner membrane protease subunit 1 [Pseudocercospora fuligena]|uniref:Mitochondrial inner membrane protease subunit 1 n=1 Tax=Pseudocercospora fuligena TaxID=685502 RepID=A0A8H6VGD1_9PEZI|nr:Mitochondrial inner membrane protease subunit 1 [Pseudocercospora fuligena]